MYVYPRRPRREPDLIIESYLFWFDEKIWGHSVFYYEMIPGEWLVYHCGRWQKMLPEWFMTQYKQVLDEAVANWAVETELLGR